MEFGPSDEQTMLRENIAGILAKAVTLAQVRAAVDAEAPFAEDVWSSLVSFGATAIVVPEQYDGLGLGLFDAVLLLEEIGRVVAPVPILGSIVGARALVAAGSPAQRDEWLPKIASGSLMVALAIGNQVARRGDETVISEAGRLSGQAVFAIDVAAATMALVADRMGGLHLVALNAPGLAIERLGTLDRTRGFASLSFDMTPADALPGGGAARIVDESRVLLAAEMLGAAQTMLNNALGYASERVQFGRPIGSFQAVKHMCAEMAAKLEPCKALMWYAAYAQDERPAEARRVAAHAKAHISEVARFVARTAIEVHGGVGLTEALGLEYWFKRIETDRQLLGSPELVRADVAREQGWGLPRAAAGR